MNTKTAEAFETIMQDVKAGNGEEVETTLRNFIRSAHPTLQESFFRRMILSAVRIYAEKDSNGEVDARNKGACNMAARMYSSAMN